MKCEKKFLCDCPYFSILNIVAVSHDTPCTMFNEIVHYEPFQRFMKMLPLNFFALELLAVNMSRVYLNYFKVKSNNLKMKYDIKCIILLLPKAKNHYNQEIHHHLSTMAPPKHGYEKEISAHISTIKPPVHYYEKPMYDQLSELKIPKDSYETGLLKHLSGYAPPPDDKYKVPAVCV